MSHHNMMDDQLSLVIYKLLLYQLKGKMVFSYPSYFCIRKGWYSTNH